jgi:hypothetical protein
LAIVRDLLSALGFALRASGEPGAHSEAVPKDEEESGRHAGAFERVDVIVPWAALGVLVSAVIRASVPDSALQVSLWLAMPAAIVFALSVKVHAAAAPSLAFALADRGLPLQAALVALVLMPFALDLRNAKQALFILVPVAFAVALGDRIPHPPLMLDSKTAIIAAACIGAVLLARAYELGFRGLLLPIVGSEAESR